MPSSRWLKDLRSTCAEAPRARFRSKKQGVRRFLRPKWASQLPCPSGAPLCARRRWPAGQAPGASAPQEAQRDVSCFLAVGCALGGCSVVFPCFSIVFHNGFGSVCSDFECSFVLFFTCFSNGSHGVGRLFLLWRLHVQQFDLPGILHGRCSDRASRLQRCLECLQDLGW